MIVDKIGNLKKYFKNYNDVIDRVLQIDKFGIDKSGLYEQEIGNHKIIVETKNTYPNPTLESHQIYSDIHCVLQGEEEILIYSIDDVITTSRYSLSKDVTLYSSSKEPMVRVKVAKGWFVYLEPREIHSPWNPVRVTPRVDPKIDQPPSTSFSKKIQLPSYQTANNGNILQKMVVKLLEE